MPEPPSRRTAAVLVATMLVVPAVAVFLVRSSAPALRPAAVPSSAPATALAPASPDDRASEIRGRILDGAGNPVDGAAVHLVSAHAPETVIRDANTDRVGRFSFAQVGPAAVRVVADHDPEGTVSSAELRVIDRLSIEITLVLSPLGSVLGTVSDADGRPVSGAALSVEGVPWTVRATTSDDAGAFRLPSVPIEATSLVAVATGYRTARVPLARRDDQADVVVRVRLAAAPPVDGEVRDADDRPVRAVVVACEGQPAEARAVSAEDGTFQLPPSTIGCGAVARHEAYAPSDLATIAGGRRIVLRLKAGGSIDGVVVDERARGVPSFTVGIESFSGAQPRSPGSAAPRSFEDPRGAFRWDKLEPGSYVLTATASGKAPTRSDPIDVIAGAVASARIVLPEGGSVTGRIYDERQAPLEGADVQFDSVSSVIQSPAGAKTDQAGRYRVDGAPRGPLTLRVQKEGFRTRLLSGLRVEPHGMLTKDVMLTALDGGPGLELGGIGANLISAPGGISLAAVYGGDPADRAGLRAGDRIVRVDGEETERMSVADALQRLRGEPGTAVSISAQRPTGEIVDVSITRAAIVH